MEYLDVLISVYCLATPLQVTRQYDGISDLYQRTITGFKRVLGFGFCREII
jgi:hypothetical protein